MASVLAVRATAPAVTKARHALVRVALAAVLANSTWFSATAVVPALERDWGLTAAGAAWLVVAVQAGFIAGSIAAALLNLPDRIEPRRLGHMCELYAFWAWLPTFFVASRHAVAGADPARLQTGAIVFAAVGVAGLSGAILAGRLADRVGRTITTSAAMVVSAACCVARPWVYLAPTAVLVAVLLVWGASVIADSAQFSASVTELAEPRYAGSALTLQLALGFALTIASIRLVPVAADAIGWRFALVPLAAGPLAGTTAMVRLHALPAARQLAHGRR